MAKIQKIFLALLLAAAAPAWAAQTPGLYDISDHGAVVGQPVDAAAEAAYQAARAYRRPATLRFPPGVWTFRRPLVADLDGLTIQGSGKGTTTLRASGAFPPILLGIRRAPAGRTLTAAHRPDAFGKLDANACDAPGKLFGYRTMGTAHLGLWASPFDRGASDGWRSTRRLTIAWCFEGGLGGFGMASNGVDPWSVRAAGSSAYIFEVRTSDGAYRTFVFALPGDPKAMHRCAVQLDLAAATCQAYVDGKQVGVRAVHRRPPRPEELDSRGAVKPDVDLSTTFAAGDNLRFRPKDSGVFGVGRLGPDLAMAPGTEDWTIYGLRLSADCPFADDGPEKPMRRLDGRQVIDRGLLFGTGAELIALLEAIPPEGENDRLVRWRSGEASGESRIGYGLFLHSGVQSSGNHSVLNTTVRDLTIDLNYSRWGQALSTGGTIGLAIHNVELIGGWHGLGSAPLGASWPTKVVDLKAEGYDASIALVGHTIDAERIDCGYAGTTAMRLQGCSGTVRGVWLNGQINRGEVAIDVTPTDEAINLIIQDVRCNQEGLPWPSVAAIRITPPRLNRELAANVILRDIYWGNVGPDASLVRLEEGGGKSPCNFELDGASMEASRVGVVTMGPRWLGWVRPIDPARKKTWIRHDGPGECGLMVMGADGVRRPPGKPPGERPEKPGPAKAKAEGND